MYWKFINIFEQNERGNELAEKREEGLEDVGNQGSRLNVDVYFSPVTSIPSKPSVMIDT